MSRARTFTLPRAAILALALVSGACGESPGQPDGPDADVDAAACEAGTATLPVVTMVAESPRTPSVPLAAVTVALDAPGGGRVEQSTDEQGRTVFTGINWSCGEAAVTAHQEGYRLLSIVNLSEPVVGELGGEVNMQLEVMDASPVETVLIVGEATNMASIHNYLYVSNDIYGSEWAGLGSYWQLAVLPNEPFMLVGVEYYQGERPEDLSDRGIWVELYGWTVLEHPGVSEATVIEGIDFSVQTRAATRTGDYLVYFPPREDSPLQIPNGVGGVVHSQYPQMPYMYGSVPALIGYYERADVTADGEGYEYSMQWIEPDGVESPITNYFYLRNEPGSLFSETYVFLDGYPDEVSQPIELLDVPEMISPPDNVTEHPLHAPLEFELFDAGVYVDCTINNFRRYVWRVVSPTDATSLTVPEPPSTVNKAELLGTYPLDAVIGVYRGELLGQTPQYVAAVGWFLLVPPKEADAE